MSVWDDRVLGSRGRPRRIVSLVPCVTETVVALGAGDRLVGVTRFCAGIAGVGGALQVGGTKDPNCGQIIETRPDVVFMSDEENRREDFDCLQAAGVAVFVSCPRRPEEIASLIERLGLLLGCESAATGLAAEIFAAIEAVSRARCQGRSARRVFCPIWRDPWMSFNGDTYAGGMLRLGGAANVCAAERERYCRVTMDAIAARGPEIVLLPDEPYRFAPEDLPSLAPVLQGNAAARVRFVDGRLLYWYGSRTPTALRALRDIICEHGE